MTVEWGLRLRVKWNTRVHNDVLPSAVLEEVEDSETILNAVIMNQILQQFWVCAEYQQ